jgi:AhpD family alkylhydroperoxidase
MTERIAIAEHSPAGYRAVNSLDAYIVSSLEGTLKDFINLRASLINRCTYCVDSHSVDLQAAGVPLRKIFSVTTWRESTFFTERERAAFALTEEITLISEHGVSDAVWDAAAAVFSEKELADVVLAISTINVWNRIAISTQMAPPPLAE